MKKFYFLASALLAVTTLKAQFTIVDFEDLTLPEAENYYNGSDEAGGFTSQGVHFGNYYETTDWGYFWNGFSYSNLTDNETAGFGNQYSSFAGKGKNNSENYAIFYPSDTITFPGDGANFGTVGITNTTYAGLSMTNGDAFAKQFGSPNGADGEPDGTDGKDFFYVTINGWDHAKEAVASVYVYLADFRSDNSDDHFILKDWITVDLSALNGSKYISFSLTSSDVGDWGINTPTYFALDNLQYEEITLSVPNNQLISSLYPNPAQDRITIESTAGQLKLIDLNGKVHREWEHTGIGTYTIIDLPKGIYFVQLAHAKGLSTQKLIIQ